MFETFDGSADLRRYERSVFTPRQCEFMAFESYDTYTLTRLLFEGRETYLFIIKSGVAVEAAPNGTFAHFIRSGASLAFSVAGAAYIADSKAAQFAPPSTECFVGFSADGTLKLTPAGVMSAVELGVVHGVEASPFLVVNGKRLAIKDEAKRSRDRLLVGQLRTGEPVFIYVKSCDVASAADIAYQLGCMRAAVIANERSIDICGKGVMLNRMGGSNAAFVVR